jgi:sigma-B regulation protein RsbU (phosphoserine phosphatase)
LLVTGSDGTILRVNRTFREWLGYADEELVQRMRLQDLLNMGGRIFHQTHWQPLMQIQGSVSEVKFEVIHKAGRKLPMVMNAVRRERDGVVSHEVAAFIAEDRNKYERELLLERRRAEQLLLNEQAAQRALQISQERLNLALDAAELCLWEIDPDVGVPRYAEQVALLLGEIRPRAVSHAEYRDHIHPDDRIKEADAWQRANAPDGGRYHASYRLQGTDGVERAVAATGRAFFDASGRLVQWVGILHDVTDIHRQRAAAVDRALFAEQMVGIVSHDLRNPLSVIQMSATLLERLDPTPQQVRALRRITSAAGRASRLVGDLLDFTQARVGRGLQVCASELELHRFVAEAVEELSFAFPGRAIVHQAHGEPVLCFADADRLAQAIGNLVANAVSYGAPDRPVTVASAADEEHFCVTVHNDGPPVPAELIPNLFEPMSRGEGQKHGGRSVGLGLFIVREIIMAHHGTVSVHSTAALGTTFTLRVPRQRELSAVSASPVARRVSPGQKGRTTHVDGATLGTPSPHCAS